MSNLREKLTSWLESHDSRIDRFREPVAISALACEVDETPQAIEEYLRRSSTQPIYHPWEHTFRGKTSRSKPYCLRLNGPETVGLDWEDSVVGAAESEFRRLGYQTARELGTEEHISALAEKPDLSVLVPGTNLRDLWALRKDGARPDLYIIEAKGKEAWEFDYYSFAETLSQVFPVSGQLLSELLGASRGPGHGLCLKFANRLHGTWTSQGLAPTITVAVLVPEWTPDVVWMSGRPTQIPGCYYSRPLSAFREFLATGRTDAESGAYKYLRAFGKILQEIEGSSGICSLAQASTGIRFRLLTTRCADGGGDFVLSGL